MKNKEIGSFLELDLKNTGEYYSDKTNIARLNSGRAGIYHALRILNVDVIYLPFYLCPSVRNFLNKKNIKILYYRINEMFIPQVEKQIENSAFLVVNYFGILSNNYLKKISKKYKNVIVDNSVSFFSKPMKNGISVYSTRKFFGVPDGAYVIGKNTHLKTEGYEKDYSADTALFLLKRIEVGSSASYKERMKNEKRIEESDIKTMSKLTSTLLKGIDYKWIKKRRRKNFNLAHSIFKDINLLDPTSFLDKKNVPMVYPLLIEDVNLVNKLQKHNIYTGRWWKNVIKEVPENSFENKLSKYMVPLPIDQRYGEKELEIINKIII